MTHLLVTNDFPPKLGGIQSYLWELWRRLPPGEAVVLTTPYDGADAFDAAHALPIERTRQRFLLPTPVLARQIERVAADHGASSVLVDPALPLGLLAPHVSLPYGVLVHGAEITVPGRAPGARLGLARVLRGAQLVVASSDYAAGEAARLAGIDLPAVTVHPGIDGARFRPLTPPERIGARQRFGLPAEGRVVVGLSRLVRRKGFDVLIEAASQLGRDRPDLLVVIAGTGRDERRLRRLADRSGAPVSFVGRVSDGDLPLLLGAADVFAMLCRNRWGGVEQEGFGIVFAEAAAAGVAVVAGASGGAAEAVADGETGIVVAEPHDVGAVAAALARLLDDATLRADYGAAGRARALQLFDRDHLAGRLRAALAVLP